MSVLTEETGFASDPKVDDPSIVVVVPTPKQTNCTPMPHHLSNFHNYAYSVYPSMYSPRIIIVPVIPQMTPWLLRQELLGPKWQDSPAPWILRQQLLGPKWQDSPVVSRPMYVPPSNHESQVFSFKVEDSQKERFSKLSCMYCGKNRAVFISRKGKQMVFHFCRDCADNPNSATVVSKLKSLRRKQFPETFVSHNTCHSCGMHGHPVKYCPNKWRYFSKKTVAPVSSESDVFTHNEKFCCRCAGKGHWACECSLTFEQFVLESSFDPELKQDRSNYMLIALSNLKNVIPVPVERPKTRRLREDDRSREPAGYL